MGDDVRLSKPITQASFVRNPLDFLPNSLNPSLSLEEINVGSNTSTRQEISPGGYELRGRVLE
ncbi:MAG: hypothetical protein K2J15_01775, partial [Muribaculaceae bacterium]|nr:hypothetical protein [Muribaculaceae bacterium]